MSHFIKEKSVAIMSHRSANYVLLAFIFGCIFSYIYFANMAVRTLTVLENTKDEVQSLSVRVSEMEAKRLSVENTMGSVMARHLGLVEVGSPTFIMNKTKKTALSLKID